MVAAEAEQEQPEAKAAADEAATAATIRRLTAEAQLSVANLTAASLLGVPTDTSSSSGASNTAAKLEDGAAKSLRGPWSYRVGLVGKPSAGKSSLFNALTRAGFARVVGSAEASDGSGSNASGGGGEECAEAAPPSSKTSGWGEGTLRAKMGATPFTTIDPNIGVARYAAPASSEPSHLINDRTPTSYGRSSDGRRLLPCTLIDVAGLVPGAYTGRGKGNQFLADLTTADALVHVVDASGMTDSGGNPTVAAFEDLLQVSDERSSTTDNTAGVNNSESGSASVSRQPSGASSDAADEIEWVSREVHLWIHTNLTAKLHTWRKRPDKLAGKRGSFTRAALTTPTEAAA